MSKLSDDNRANQTEKKKEELKFFPIMSKLSDDNRANQTEKKKEEEEK